MRIRVKLFAAARELAGSNEIVVELRDGATIAELRDELTARVPTLGRIMPHSLWAIGAEYVNDDAALNENADVALIPPVSGG